MVAIATKPGKGLTLGKLSDVAKMVVSKGRETEIPLSKVKFDPKQPRKAFHHLDGRIDAADEAHIAELAASIEKNGLIEPITVQELPDGTYLVVVGECRTRAHLKLNRTMIRANVHNELSSPAKRLLFQLAENVNRKDLSDDEMAASIRQLMEGTDGDAPMNQAEIATYFGKSEGWVTRFVKFGDEEMQRVWVKSGIADTVEKVYRLSILPKAAQVDILRRVELPEGDPDRLEKPLNRNIIDELAREAKAAKQNPRPTALTGAASQQGMQTPTTPLAGSPDDAGAIAQALAETARGGGATTSKGGDAAATSLSTGGYQLPDDARANILGSIPMPDASTGKSARDSVEPPVNCRVSVGNLNALLEVLKLKPEMLSALGSVRCEVSIPGPLAKLVANELVGVIVNDQEVPAVLQTELTKLS